MSFKSDCKYMRTCASRLYADAVLFIESLYALIYNLFHDYILENFPYINKVEAIRHIFTVGTVAFCFCWMILPMLFLRGDYCFAVHDGMDSYAAIVQLVHENHLYFHLNQSLPIMNGIEGKYTFLGFTLYDFYNCIFGYVTGQILTRITGCFIGFFFFRHLMGYLYPERGHYFDDFIMLISVLYIVTPISPIRTIGFASLPFVVETFLRLRNEEGLSARLILCTLFPFFTIFDGLFFFVIWFWAIFSAVDYMRQKRINKNLLLGFLLMCIFTMIVNYNFVIVALSAKETTRQMYVDRLTELNFDMKLFKYYFLNGQHHATFFPRKFIIPVCITATIVLFLRMLKDKCQYKTEIMSFSLVCAAWGIHILGTWIRVMQESGFRVGVLLVDGFQWGRLTALTFFTWPLMLVALFYIFRNSFLWKNVFYFVVCAQLVYVATLNSTYNDTYTTIRNEISAFRNGNRPMISYNDFVSAKLFDDIKRDISYNGEGVAAFGYHPAVLLLNQFNTVDGYFSVHSSKWHNQFKEIIAPELEMNEKERKKYNEWGGRMYLCGALGYKPTKDKNVAPTDIHINAKAYKKYGGKYILSRAKISNADEQGLTFVKDYDSEESMYHIWLYRVD